jgi:UDP-3-O-[3-hydroxymyristoyl] N-acetylglucosamine deacetylase
MQKSQRAWYDPCKIPERGEIMIWQKTIARPITVTDIGLHSGQPVTMSLHPASANQGLRFIRTDLPGRPQVRAHYSRVVDTTRATTLGEGSATLATVEHLLSAFYGLGIDNAVIEVDGPEVPIMDGSAKPFVDFLMAAGSTSLPWPRAYLLVHKQVELSNGDGWMRVLPGQPRIMYAIDFSHPLIRKQRYAMTLDAEHFRREIAPARTFGFLKEVQFLQSRGLARGGSLDNALVLDDTDVLNPGGLRFPEEFVRHKILDVLGDLALLGMPIIGRLEISRGSHDLHQQFVQHLIDQENAWRLWVPPTHNRTPRRTFEPVPFWEGAPA